MRKFTEKEKKIIRSFVTNERKQIRTFSAREVYMEVIKNLNHSIEIDLDAGVLRYHSNNDNLYILTYAEQELIDTTLLLQYLEELKLLVFIETNDNISNINHKDSTVCSEERLSEEITFLIKHYLNCKIYVSSLMIDIVENDFKSLEEHTLDEAKKQLEESRNQTIEAQKQSQNSRKTMWISVVTLVAAIATLIVAICSLFKQDRDVFINEKQVIEFKQNTDSIYQAIKENQTIIQVEIDTCCKNISAKKLSQNK